MKTAIFSLLLLCAMLLCILCNALYINKVAFCMERDLSALPHKPSEEASEQVGAILSYWEAQTPYLSLSVGFPLLDRIGEQLRLLQSYARSGDSFGYAEALTVLLDCIQDLCRLERLSLENLL